MKKNAIVKLREEARRLQVVMNEAAVSARLQKLLEEEIALFDDVDDKNSTEAIDRHIDIRNRGHRLSSASKRMIAPIEKPFDLAFAAATPAAELMPFGSLITGQGTIEFFEIARVIYVRVTSAIAPDKLTMGTVDFSLERPKGGEALGQGLLVVPKLDSVLVNHFIRLSKSNSKRSPVKWK